MTDERDIARILLCDDSPSYAEALTLFLEQDADLRVVGRCAAAEEAVDMMRRLRPDLVTMDLELPGADGVDAVRWITKHHPVPVLVLSAHVSRGSERAAEALGAGALDAFPKREISLSQPHSARAIAFRRRVKRLASARATSNSRPPSATGVASRARGGPASIVAVCASTGGPAALATVLGSLPAHFPVPVLIVQHMAEGFLDGLIGWLDAHVALPVQSARDGALAEPGVWFAPEGAHLVVDEHRRTVFDSDSVAGYHRPAADLLFTSMAGAVGRGAVSVVLTGMGSDGAEGTAAVRAAGGLTIAQDRRTSAIFGMPRAAAEHGAELILALPDIGSLLARLPTPHTSAS
jgi:two-component system, chemotaxis family, protein-glutamate methylesterase/glutaminase